MFALLFLSPGLLFVDNIHFQYNGFLYGIFLFSVAMFSEVGASEFIPPSFGLKSTFYYLGQMDCRRCLVCGTSKL